MTITLRAAEQSDLDALLSLYQQLNTEDPLPNQEKAAATLESLRRNPMTQVLVAADSEKVLGSCTLIIVPNLTRNLAPYAVIENVVSDEGSRRRGVGKIMMSHAIDAAWDAGCYKVMLMTGRKRDGPIAFYESLGFRADSKTGMEIRRP